MLEVYKITPILKHTVQIECITSYNDNVLLGTRQGQLFMYNLVKTADDKIEVQLMQLHKTFSKKQIVQLEVMPDYNALISLTDNLVQVHNINSFNFITTSTLQKTKGATLFALDCTQKEGKNEYRLCVVVKRKLQLYTWNGKEFDKRDEDINLVEIPKSIAWCQDTICIGCKGEYYCCKLNDKPPQPKELFPTSSNRSTEPFVVKASENTFSLIRENQMVLINSEGAAEKQKLIKWTDIPSAIIWDDPYCIALLGDAMEVQTIESGCLIQSIPDMPKVRFITRAQQGLMFAASISQVWVLEAVDISMQRKILIENKQFQLALKLTHVSKESEEEKEEIIYQIETQQAYDLFTKKQFTESMAEFARLETNPSFVIRLFPDLLPQQSGIPEVESAENFTSRELEEGLQALIVYLTDIRFKKKWDQKTVPTGNLNDQAVITKANKELLQIIDTTLLKCYLQTNDAFVAPLLRSNYCHLAETERTLKKYGKDNELMILYQTKGQHRKALEFLQGKENVDRTIGYLQHLGNQHMGLILEFADWVLKLKPVEGLKIFTEDLDDVETLPRPRILDYLLRSHKELVIPYLEQIIQVWHDKSPIFHNALIHEYKEKVLSNDPTAAITRNKLYQFLEMSEYYKPASVLDHFPTDSLLEERAIIVGKLGRHDQALAILVRVLGDVDKAVLYCDTIYKKKIPGSDKIFVLLIQIILDPDCFSPPLSNVVMSPKTAQPDLEKALNLLEEYAACINPINVLEVLPENISVSRIYRFLQVALHENLRERRRNQLLKRLLCAEHLQCQELRLQLESQNVLVTELNICPVCKKRFGNQSALVRFPNGDVVHYSCQDK